MIRTIIPREALGLLRGICDEPVLLDDAGDSRRVLGLVRMTGLGAVTGGEAFAATFALPKKRPIELDLDKLGEAQRLFAAFRTEIAGALLLAALPQSYAAEYGAGVIAANAELERDLARRIRRTAQFLLVVMQQAKDEEDQLRLWDCTAGPGQHEREQGAAAELQPWQWCVVLRGYHQTIRDALTRRRQREAAAQEDGPGPVTKLLGEHNEQPLNQEDLLGMLLTFSITVFEVLERYGITWTADEQEAYLHAWDVVGAYLGIGTPDVVTQLERGYRGLRVRVPHLPPGPIITNRWHGLRPPSVDDTRVLLDQIRERQWPDPQPSGPFELESWSSLRAGRILTRALLDELQGAMPRWLELSPITVMRALSPEIVRKRLNLGNTGVVLGALTRLPKQKLVTERFTVWNAPNLLGATILRQLANDVTTRVSVRFIQNDDYVVPGVGDWS